MHFLATQQIGIDDAGKARDLQQDPADILVLSAADSELAVLARAYADLTQEGYVPSLRLVQVRDLQHPASLDLYIEKTLSRSHLVIARLLGGQSYFPYFCEQVEDICREKRIPLALLAGEGQEDRTLYRRSTIAETHSRALYRCLLHGGTTNAKTFLLIAQELLDNNTPSNARTTQSPTQSQTQRQTQRKNRHKNRHKTQALPEAGLYLPQPPKKLLQKSEGSRVTAEAGTRHTSHKAMLLFYRALVQAEDTEPVEAMIEACAQEGIDLVAVYVSSLKSEASLGFLHRQIAEHAPRLFLNATGFALGEGKDPLAGCDCPVLQIALASQNHKAWEESAQGLSPTDLAMQVVLTEMDGRIFTRAIAFKERAARDAHTQFSPSALRSVPDRCAFVARKASRWLQLGSLENDAKRVAIMLHNYPARDGRIANGVGLDTPRALQTILCKLKHEGYDVGGASRADLTAENLLARLKAGPTNEQPRRGTSRAQLCLSDYERFFQELAPSLQESIKRVWGEACDDPFIRNADIWKMSPLSSATDGAEKKKFFALPTLLLGKVAVALQPSRGYERDADAIAHDPNLPPPHAYLAQYLWLQRVWQSCALVHVGKHGTAEWLPGKAVALSRECACEAVLAEVPHLYPFIVSDPGEGTQAKRRGAAVVIDHLSPPLARAELYGDSAALERLLDEYAEARVLHPRRAELLAREIAELGKRSGLLEECAEEVEAEVEKKSNDGTRLDDATLARLDGHLCDLKELQIRGGLHRFGEAQSAAKRAESLCALLRLPRGEGEGEDSLLRAIGKDCNLAFDPLDSARFAVAWKAPCPQALASYATKTPRCNGDVVALLEAYALALVKGDATLPPPCARDEGAAATRAVLENLRDVVAPLFDACAAHETSGLLRGLSGKRVAPGPSGAPSRARLDVLPTGRNFYSVDVRAVPSQSAWQLGWRSAALLVERYCEEHGCYPRRMALSAWGTACMRTGGEDLAQMLALMGVRPLWQEGSGRVDGFEILPPDSLGRPRVDVTLRVSGFFRDAFPRLLALLDAATRAVAALEEGEEENPLAALVRSERTKWGDAAFYRIFGSAPGSYGTGLNVPIDSGRWKNEAELARTYLHHSAYAYTGEGATRQRAALERRLENLDAIVHNQDNREHDLLDSDDYYQFEGGLAVSAKTLSKSGKPPVVYHNDHSRPFAPRIVRLEQELARVVRARAANPKWIAAMRLHGYKGASEIAATLDYLFAFAATTGLVKQRHFDALFDAYLKDKETRDFLARVNPDALRETAARFREARQRGLWTTRRNDVPQILEENSAEEKTDSHDKKDK